MAGPVDDWREALDRLLVGDRHAFVALDRLVTGVLLQLRAYDYRDDWDELRHVVLDALIANARAGRLPDSQAVAGYVQILTRQKMVEALKTSLGHASARMVHAPESGLRAAVGGLADDEQQAQTGIDEGGGTFQAVSDEIGIPIAAVTRRVRDALASLRRRWIGSSGVDT